MEEKRFTPGPWHWDQEGLGNKNHIVFGKEYPAEMTSRANKSLIAAAPELLEALLELVSSYDDFRTRKGKPESPQANEIIKARAAIAKALGKE